MGWNTNNKGQDRQEEEQGYLVSLGDMLSGLIFVFIITLIVFAIRLHQETKRMEQEKERYDQHTQALTDAKEIRKSLLEEVRRRLQKMGVQVEIDVENGLLRLPEQILFKSGKADFVDGGEEKLGKLAAVLGKLLPCYCGPRGTAILADCPKEAKPGRLDAVLIEGHTDNRPLHRVEYDNWNLSAERSIRTFKFLCNENGGLETLPNADGRPLIGVSAYAATRPVVHHEAETDEPRNRRIDLRFILAQPRIEEAKANSLSVVEEEPQAMLSRAIVMNSTAASRGF